MLRDKAKNDKNIDELKLPCSCCFRHAHHVLECPHLHFVPDKELAILKVSSYNSLVGSLILCIASRRVCIA